MEQVKNAIQVATKELFDVDVEPELSRVREQFGDYATNVALQLAGKLNKNPRDIATDLKAKIASPAIKKTEVAGPGFINIHLRDEALAKQAFEQKIAQPLKGQEILVEFGDPNPFKEMHLGHLYTAVVGDAIASLLSASGANVKRLSYHGDVGMHVAKWLWGRQHAEGKDDEPLGYYYVVGAKAFEQDEQAAKEIQDLNHKVYAQDASIRELYDQGKSQSFEQFDAIFRELGVNYDKRYLESEASEIGLEYVRKHVGKVFEESQGAVIYNGEKVGLHTRVFITSRGLPTYEAKDLGLTELKDNDFPEATRSIIITAHEQSEYFQVMLAALKEIDPKLADKTVHLAHGFLSLTTGKMSSRTGDVHAAKDLLHSVHEAVKAQYPRSEVQQESYLAAVKYTFLKNRIGGDIVFDVKESINIEGNSGPYLQYAYARACSILAKTQAKKSDFKDFQPGERSLVRKISEYPEVVEKAVHELIPHHVCTYLYELAQTFNRFYENNRVIGNEREVIRLRLVETYADVLKSGLNLLNIEAPDKM